MFPFRARTVPPVLYHLHIPKAAGTTLYDLLRTRFPRQKRCPVRVSLLDLIRIPPPRFSEFDLVGGHLEFGYYLPEHTGRPVRTVTLLREPRSHLLSLYKQVMQEPLDPVRAYVDAHCPTAEDFFFDPWMAAYVADPPARYLAVAERRFTPAVLERLRTAGPAERPDPGKSGAGCSPAYEGLAAREQRSARRLGVAAATAEFAVSRDRGRTGSSRSLPAVSGKCGPTGAQVAIPVMTS